MSGGVFLSILCLSYISAIARCSYVIYQVNSKNSPTENEKNEKNWAIGYLVTLLLIPIIFLLWAKIEKLMKK